MTCREYAKLLGVSRDTVRGWKKTGVPVRWQFRYAQALRGVNTVGFSYDDLGHPILRQARAGSSVAGLGMVGVLQCGHPGKVQKPGVKKVVLNRRKVG